jgi:hypothetical protein
MQGLSQSKYIESKSISFVEFSIHKLFWALCTPTLFTRFITPSWIARQTVCILI